MHQNRKHRKFHINRIVTIVMMAGYLALLFFVLCMDWYLISDYQEKNRERERQVLENSISTVEDNNLEVFRTLQNVYLFDESFQMLSMTLSEIDQYDYAYDLYNTMRSNLFQSESMDGFYIFFGGCLKVWYYADLNRIDAAAQENIYKALKKTVLEDSGENWAVLTVGEDILLTSRMKNGNAGIYTVYSLKNLPEDMAAQYRQPVHTVFIYNGLTVSGDFVGKGLELEQYAGETDKTFYKHMGKYYVYGERIEHTKLWIFNVVEGDLWSRMNGLQILILVIAGLSVAAVVFLYIFIYRSMMKPMRMLVNVMNDIRLGSRSSVPSLDIRFYELAEVNETLGRMVDEIETQKVQIYEEIIEKQKTQLSYYQLQLKPHFYLNGLKTLDALIETDQKENARQMIFNLSDHLRYLLKKDQELVGLVSEIQFTQNYIDMQNSMTGRNINIEFCMEDAVKAFKVPAFCIQTFVENSVKYARLGDVGRTLSITVEGCGLTAENGTYLDLIISDNGCGYPQEILEEINHPTQQWRSVGINNIKSRCAIIYGGLAEFNFYNDGGAVSELILPEVAKADESTVSG